MDEIINDFHDLDQIPVFQTQIDPEMMNTADRLEVLQMNIGRVCNLACKHCHVCAGPNRTEVMPREVMADCIQFAREQQVQTIDITGGAPEMNPDFEWLVTEACKVCSHVIVRTNLTVLLNPEYEHLIEFYDGAIQVLQKLNTLGYGKDPELVLNMVYNPAGAFFPPDQTAMELEYKEHLEADFGIVFNALYTLYNNPMGRFGAFLRRSGNLSGYMKKLYDAFNPATVEALMCRFQISVDYDGKLYDCDFNLAAGLPIFSKETIADWIGKPYTARKIRMDKHCYACTAGAGSS